MVHLLAKFTWSINMTNPLKDKRQDWFLGWSDLSTLTPKTENPQCFATFVCLFTDQEIKGTDVISTEKISNHSHNSAFPRVLRTIEKLDENLCSGASLGKNLSVFFREKGSGGNSLVLVKNMLQKMGKLLAFQVLFPRLEEVQRADLNREKSQFSSVQFSRSVVSDSLQPLESQHTRPPCPSPTPGVYSNSCPLSRWCHSATSSSLVPFSSCPQSLQASGSFPMSQLFAWSGQSIGVPASTSVLPMNTQDWSPLGWTGWISLHSKGLSRVFSNITVQKHQFFCAQLSSQSNSHIHTWLLEKPYSWPDGPLLAK